MIKARMSDEGVTEGAVAGLTFAVADLHGRDDLLRAALDAIQRRAASTPVGSRTIVFLGDYVDRGPDGRGVLERLSAGPPPGWTSSGWTSPGWTWICLKGNHEAMMALALRNPDRLDWWIDNGGDATIASYRDHREAIGRHLAWIEALPSLHADRHRLYVHAGVDPAKPLDAQQDKVLLWKRYPREAGAGHGTLHVVHGHDPNVDGPLLHEGRTDLDTLAWSTGRLVVGVFDDWRPGGPIEMIEVGAAASLLRGGRSRVV